MAVNEVCFNELALTPLCADRQETEIRIRLYVKTLEQLRLQKNIKKVRYHEHMTNIPLSKEMSLQEYCAAHRHDPISNLLLSTFTMPQVDEKNEPVLEKYCDTQVNVQKEGKCLKAHGFNAAYCQGTYCVGFVSEDFWKDCLYLISITSDGVSKDAEWACVSYPIHVGKTEFAQWEEMVLQPVCLQKSTLSYDRKVINLRDDHGKDVLTEHARKLLHSPYVIGVINSLPFNRNISRYILQVRENGILNIVLPWTDNGYGMAIQTTGRNIRESQEIAKILEKEYGHK